MQSSHAAMPDGVRPDDRGRAMRILVTRPEPDARALADALRRERFEALTQPLTRFEARNIQPIELSEIDGLLVTSARALTAPCIVALAPLRANPVFAVGARSAEAARAAGFDRVFEGTGGLGELKDALGTLTKGRQVLHVCGWPKVAEPAEVFGALGLIWRDLVTYDMVELEVDGHALASSAPDAVMHFSPRAADLFAGKWPAERSITHICLSDAVAAHLPRNAVRHIADRPSVSMMIECAKQLRVSLGLR